MNSLPLFCHEWPTPLAFPTADPLFVLIHISHTPRSAKGRLKVREVLREVLRSWASGPVLVHETATGPQIAEPIRGEAVFVSISYANDSAWLGISLKRPLGIDAVRIESFPEMEDLARLYLGEEVWQAIVGSQKPTLTFARHWAALEARCKRADIPLSETAKPPTTPLFERVCQDTAVVVAWG